MKQIFACMAALALFTGLTTGGCTEGAAGSTRIGDKLHAVEFRGDQLVRRAWAAMQVSGIPDPPLQPGASRKQREAFLSATDIALGTLLALPTAPTSKHALADTLSAPDITEQTLALSKVLAVALADAVDRGDAAKVESILRSALAYQDAIAFDCADHWLYSGAVADELARGLKSLDKPLPKSMADKMLKVIDEFRESGPSPQAAASATLRRLQLWHHHLETNKTPMAPERLLDAAGASSSRISRTTSAKECSPELLSAEGKLVVDTAIAYVGDPDPAARNLEIDPRTHPVAAMCMAPVKHTLEAAPKLDAIRLENLRLLSLTIRLLAADIPDSLASFGSDAKSPYSGLAFEYRKTKDGFDLLRPRAKA